MRRLLPQSRPPTLVKAVRQRLGLACMQGDQRLSVPYSAHVSAHIRDQGIIIRQSVILSPGSDARLIKGDARYILMYKDQYLIFE